MSPVTKPGGIYEFTREGQITYTYSFDSGDQMLDHPSLVEQLPTGLFCVNDDYRHRVVIIDPNTKQIVWQYGQTDAAGTRRTSSTPPTDSTFSPRTTPHRPIRTPDQPRARGPDAGTVAGREDSAPPVSSPPGVEIVAPRELFGTLAPRLVSSTAP
jgi:hypothetical protein